MTDKRTLKTLERIFSAEMFGKEIQLGAQTAKRLEAEGLVESVIHHNQDRLGTFTWTTHALTHRGRIAYCDSCRDVDIDADDAP